MRTGILVVAIAVIAGIATSPIWMSNRTESSNARNAGDSSRLSELLSDSGIDAYARAVEPREFVFPADHGPHPDFRNEWWYLTGNLDGAKGERFGFELTLFRFAVSPPQDVDPNASAWKTNQVYIGHFAITDVGNTNFHVAQRYSRGSLGLAGARADPPRVWLEDWFIEYGDAAWRLQANDADMSIDLSLRPLKPPVLNGIDGLSQKSAAPGNASYYYSIPRLATAGTLTVNGEEYAVSGLTWLDREWGSSGLSREQEGWDWFAVQLSDGSDLMFYSLRNTDGSRDPHSAGTWITADGRSMYLRSEDVEIDVNDYWASPLGGTYPMGWQLRVAQLDLELRITPVLDAQELRTTVRYWEGAVDVVGSKASSPVEGRGYVELTGYARADRGNSGRQ